MSTFNDLPLLVKSMIFKQLELQDIKSCRCICKNWTFAIDHYSSQLNYAAELDDWNYQHVFNCGVPILELNVVNLTAKLPLSSTRRQDFTTSIKSLTFSTSMENWAWKLHKLATSGVNMRKLLEGCMNIRCLKFLCSPFMNVENSDFFKSLCLPQLQELKIEMIGRYNLNQHNCITSITNHAGFPSLKKLDLDFFHVRKYCGKQYYKLYVNMFDFIGRHHETLLNLAIKHPEDVIMQPCFDTFESWRRNHVIVHNLNKILLDEFHIGTSAQAGSIVYSWHVWKYEIKIASKQNQLRSLHLNGSHIFPFRAFQDLIIANHSTLEELDTSGLILDEVVVLDPAWFKNAKRLQHLTLIPPVIVINAEQLPTSLISLTWSLRRREDLLWILRNLKLLETLRLCDFNHTIGLISLEIFRQIVTLLPKLRLLYLDCPHESVAIRSFIRAKMREGYDLHYGYGGKILINDSLQP